MRSAHLSLAVADRQRSRRFYEMFIGLHSDDARVAFHCWNLDGYQVETFWAK